MRLVPSNLTQLKQLRHVYAEAFLEQKKYTSNIPTDEYLTKILENKHIINLVETDGAEQVIGGLTAYILQKIEQPTSELYLYDLAVLATHRRKGVATRLIEELKIIGRDFGANVIFVQADNIDAPAIALYELLCSTKETDITHFDIKIDCIETKDEIPT